MEANLAIQRWYSRPGPYICCQTGESGVERKGKGYIAVPACGGSLAGAKKVPVCGGRRYADQCADTVMLPSTRAYGKCLLKAIQFAGKPKKLALTLTMSYNG
eukprot:scaffold21131_cov14-Tisochrysis_lutea.AAC.1